MSQVDIDAYDGGPRPQYFTTLKKEKPVPDGEADESRSSAAPEPYEVDVASTNSAETLVDVEIVAPPSA